MKEQKLVSPDKSMQVSISKLEDLLAKSSSTDHTGMVQKLKALQLVEQMIAAQEQLISQDRDGMEGLDTLGPAIAQYIGR